MDFTLRGTGSHGKFLSTRATQSHARFRKRPSGTVRTRAPRRLLGGKAVPAAQRKDEGCAWGRTEGQGSGSARIGGGSRRGADGSALLARVNGGVVGENRGGLGRLGSEFV